MLCYTRAQAIVDGVLSDVTPQAKEADFKSPVAIGFLEKNCHMLKPCLLKDFNVSVPPFVQYINVM